MRKWRITACFVAVLCLATAITLPAQTFKSLLRFTYVDGATPTRGWFGNLYGTTDSGGTYGVGTVFRITPAGTLRLLISFNTTDGSSPVAGSIQGTDGNFYGTTQYGGPNNCPPYGLNCGTVFKITPSGTLTTLHSFCPQSGCADGFFPEATLIQGPKGNFYGTTIFGGSGGAGTAFTINSSGTLTTLYNFCSESGCTDGEYSSGGLVLGTNGDLYGTTEVGGANGDGTIFKITPNGSLTTVYSFDGTDGAVPYAALVEGNDGNFYGTTWAGGASESGTVFKITSSGTLTTLYTFCSEAGCADGAYPSAPLIQASDGNLYGTTAYGGEAACQYGCGRSLKSPCSGS